MPDPKPADAAAEVPGPEEPFDIHIAPDSFEYLSSLLGTFPDLARVRPVRRRHPSLVVNHPDLVGHVLAKNYKNYRKGPGVDQVRMLLGNGIIVSDGDFWLDHRRMIQPAFHKDVLRGLEPVFAASIGRLLAEWEEAADAGRPVNLTQDVSDLSLEVISRTLFGADLDWMVEETGENPFAFLSEERARDLSTVVRFRALTKLIQRVIDGRREGAERLDMISLMMASRHPRTGEPMPDRELIDEITTLIVAGHETTASALNWLWYLVSQNPEIERRLHEEVDALAEERPGFSALSGLGLARRAARETLRLYPPVWLFTRTAIGSDRLGEVEVDPGTHIFLSPYFLHRRLEEWRDSECFDPSRFEPEAEAERHRFAYIPFSAGPRRCIGDEMSLIEMQLVVGWVARKLRLRYLGPVPPAITPAINLRSREHLHFAAERR